MLDGACRIKDVVGRAKELGQPALAITDHGVMYGIVDFNNACEQEGVKPIFGCEVYIVPTDHRNRTDKSNYHLVLLAETMEGYHNLIKLVSYAHRDGFYYKPRIDRALLSRHAAGLIGLSACLHGEVASHLVPRLRGDEAGEMAQVMEPDVVAAEEALSFYLETLGKDNFFLEVQDHGIVEERRALHHLKQLSAKFDVPLVATNDIHYLKREHAAAHEVMLALQTQALMSDPKRWKYGTDQIYMKSREEMEELFPEIPEALDITSVIAERCQVVFPKQTLHFPVFPLPEGESDQREYLETLSGRGLEKIYGIGDFRAPADEREKAIVDRFQYELGVIANAGFTNYFLVVQDFIRFALDNGIPVGPGRGSGAGSIVAYACGITAIDPLRYDLIFERFLNPDRVSPPDFDIDFCQTRRGEVIDYVKRRYGDDHVAQIVTFGALGAKTLVRDIGRAMEIPLEKVNAIAKAIPTDPKTTLASARRDNPEFDRLCTMDPDMVRMLPHAIVLEGLYRHAGVHAAGVVIGEKPLIELIPLGQDKEGQSVSQYAKDPIEQIGLLKMDFLGLKTLSILKEAVTLVKERHGIDIDLNNLDLNDQEVYAIYRNAETIGIFQFESEGMQRYLQELAPTRIEDLIAMNALYRPGPMDVIPDFIARKKGEKSVAYDHPLLEPIVKETYGFMVYQEQVQRAANVLAGYSLGKADILRRAMGKKKIEVMTKERISFIEGCAATNDIPAEQAEQIFNNIEKFAGYGFNKAHAAAYAVVSYQTAYMKTHWPAEFMSAVITLEMGNFDKMPVFINEAARMGFAILPPDVNRSGVKFAPEGGVVSGQWSVVSEGTASGGTDSSVGADLCVRPGAHAGAPLQSHPVTAAKGIRYGMAGIKGVGESAAAAIVAERASGGEFKGYEDFIARIDGAKVSKGCLEALIKCGALDGFGLHRARLLHTLETVANRAEAKRKDDEAGQTSLFDLMADPTAPDGAATLDDLPDCPPMERTEELACERALLGIYVTGHPLARLRHVTHDLTSVETATKLLSTLKPGASHDLRLFGQITTVTRRYNKDKKAWAILLLEDEQGNAMEALCFFDAYATYEAILQPNATVLLCGELYSRNDRTGFSVREAYPLADVPKHFANGLSLHARENALTPDKAAALKTLLQQHPGPLPVTLLQRLNDGRTVTVRLPATLAVTPSDPLFAALAALGSLTVSFAYKDAIYLAPRRRFSRPTT
ncbi:MAG: DNA polymerase III subunit alpha [Kiritimatiellaeota bacterium]|nr:DNA polymerase III subunit alpha [Kiritimatiellota bacterium]